MCGLGITLCLMSRYCLVFDCCTCNENRLYVEAGNPVFELFVEKGEDGVTRQRAIRLDCVPAKMDDVDEDKTKQMLMEAADVGPGRCCVPRHPTLFKFVINVNRAVRRFTS